jgi:hypothetical protein
MSRERHASSLHSASANVLQKFADELRASQRTIGGRLIATGRLLIQVRPETRARFHELSERAALCADPGALHGGRRRPIKDTPINVTPHGSSSVFAPSCSHACTYNVSVGWSRDPGIGSSVMTNTACQSSFSSASASRLTRGWRRSGEPGAVGSCDSQGNHGGREDEARLCAGARAGAGDLPGAAPV